MICDPTAPRDACRVTENQRARVLVPLLQAERPEPTLCKPVAETDSEIPGTVANRQQFGEGSLWWHGRAATFFPDAFSLDAGRFPEDDSSLHLSPVNPAAALQGNCSRFSLPH